MTPKPDAGIFPAVEFTDVSTGHWAAQDGKDRYEIIRGHDKVQGLRFGCFKNRVIWIGTGMTLDDAIGVCELEQREQEWHSENAENAAKNAVARERRKADRRSRQAKFKRIRPRLWRGR